MSSSPEPILDLSIRRPSGRITPPKHEDLASSTSASICSPGSQSCSDASETSTSSDPYFEYNNNQPNFVGKMKIPRPFKAYPKNPLSLSATVAATQCIFGGDYSDSYNRFRSNMLAQMQSSVATTNTNMRRTMSDNNGNTKRGDPAYWEKRRKNNEAAKRSRDARRAKEDELAIRTAFLEQENIKLRYEVATLGNENVTLRDENSKLRNAMYARSVI